MPKSYRYTILFISWLVLITSLSLFSLSGLDSVSNRFKIPHSDKIVHFIFYFFSTIIGSYALREHKHHEISLKRAGKKMFLFSVLYGMIIEILQYSLTQNRHGDFLDFLANTIGAFCGLLMINYYFSSRVSRK